ncbi:MarR family transcriptional regulator [Actinacidiphila alni]|uniref:MarR family winged helix-turn-helix transcriptional regulator n=1 Tax=Actinacidiphila alni TaxID=380248 RepID=UPI0033CDEF46
MVNAVLTASRLLIAVSARSLAAVEEALTLPQFRMLVILSTRGQLSLSALAAELDVQPSTAMRMIDRLVAANMATRTTPPDNRRTTVISLTRAGRTTVTKVTAKRRSEIARIVGAMPAEQRRDLITALQTFTEAGAEPSARDTGTSHLGW